MARLGVPVGGQVRKLRAVRDLQATRLSQIRAGLEGGLVIRFTPNVVFADASNVNRRQIEARVLR